MRLPTTVRPRRYRLHLDLDVPGRRFSGHETIEVEVDERQEALTLHAVDLVVEGRPADGTVTLEGPWEPGVHEVSLSFAGVLDGRLKGLYLSRAPEGDLAVTQFEPDFARRVFPCFDEPSFKAVFELTLSCDGEAVSNAPLRRREGRLAEFAPTPRMSTYLLALVNGPLAVAEEFQAAGVPVRILTTPARAGLTGFAAEVVRAMLPAYLEYYGQPYPGEKLDLVGVPDFGSGAMENLGCILFREADLLAGESLDSRTDVAITVAHELAHLWFGDLVTMAWWDDLWLNEAFATWAETRFVHEWQPDWGLWSLFALDRDAALSLDALRTSRPIHAPVESPDQAKEMFDLITYKKGAAVLGMLERALGPEVFRAGVRRYLAAHAFGNASTDDLWRALEEASGEPVARIMGPWVGQAGFPLLHAEIDGETLRVRQERYPRDDGTRWPIPVGGGWLWGDEGEFSGRLEGGPFRTLHGPRLWERTLAKVRDLPPLERLVLVQDGMANALAGLTTFARWRDLVQALQDETDRAVLKALAEGWRTLDRLAPGSATGPFPASDVPEMQELRATLGGVREAPGDPDARTRAEAYWGDAARYDEHLAAFRKAGTPDEEHRFLYALACYRDPALLRRTLEAAVDGTIRGQDAGRVFRFLIARPAGQRPAVDFLESHWEAMRAAWPMQGMRLAVVGAGDVCEPDLVERLRAFLPAHPVEAGARPLAQTLERLAANLVARERYAGFLASR